MDDNMIITAENEEIVPKTESAIRWYESITFDDARAFIRENIASASRSFIAVGYYLKFVRDRSLYAPDGYESVWEFAYSEYGISKSTASRYMAMNDKFSQDGNSPYVALEYKDFGKSQLQEMLYLNDTQLEQVTPETQVKQIREIRRETLAPYTGEQIPGQFDISDFPDYLPDEPEPEAAAAMIPRDPVRTVLSVEDMIDAAESQRDDDGIAISQQEEVVSPDVEDIAEEVTSEEPEKVIDVEVIKMQEQPELPILKNNDQRAAFVEAYETWPLWIETIETEERYYRYDLPDGSTMVVKVYLVRLFDYQAYGAPYEQRFRDGWGKPEYYLLRAEKHFKDCEVNKSYLVEYLKDIQKAKAGEL